MGDSARGVTLGQSFEHCRRMARGSSFYPAFFLVDRERRRALWTVYAFNRRCDDLSDSPEASLAGLQEWRAQLDAALAGGKVEDAIWPAFVDTARRYEIPVSCFHGMIDGVSSDLTQSTRETYDDLYRYCFQVASVVGISVACIFGAQSEEARKLAERNGVAVQLTNILRDVREDEELGRTYLAQEDLRRYGRQGTLREYGRRAKALFEEGRPLLEMVEKSTRPCLRGILDTYGALLAKMERRDFDVSGERVRLSKAEKLGVLAKALLRG